MVLRPLATLVVVLTVLACSHPSPTGPPRLDPALAAQREALHAAEIDALAARADAAVAEGDWHAAAVAIAAGHPLEPTRFRGHLPTVLEALPPATAAELARAVGRDEADRLRSAAERRALAERYAALQVPDDIASVTVAHGAAAIAAAREAYFDEVDHTDWFDAARQRLQEVAAVWGVAPGPLHRTAPSPFGDLWRLGIDAGLPEPVVVAETTEAAFAALDRWSRPVWPAEITTWTRQHDGIQVGIGVQLFEREGGVTVGHPVPGSAAWDADIEQDDVIVAVGGTRVAAMPPPAIDAVVEALHGPPGSSIAVTRSRDGAERTIELVRRAVEAETVVGYSRAPDNTWRPWVDEARGIAYVRLRAVRPHSDEAFDRLLEGLAPKALVLDLRGNAGGDVKAALEIADRFVADGVLVELVGRTVSDPVPGPDEVPWNVAVPGHALERLASDGRPRLVVLVDEGTSSAAELLALILRTRADAVLVGVETFGKLSTQVLGSDDALPVAWQITHGQLVVPDAPPLGEGIVPDHEVALSPAEGVLVDVLLARREHLRSHRDGTPIRYTGPEPDGTLPPLDRDPQLAMALAVLSR